MANVILLEHVTLDVFLAGPNGETDWITYDDKLVNYVFDLRKTVEATIYGRVTYQMKEDVWQAVLNNPNSSENDLDYARWIEKKLKIVVSRTLTSVTWKNTKLINYNLADEVNDLKHKLEGDILLIGSLSLV